MLQLVFAEMVVQMRRLPVLVDLPGSEVPEVPEILPVVAVLRQVVMLVVFYF